MRTSQAGKRLGLLAVAILLLSFAAYAPAVDYPYVQDAVQAVETNPVVARGDVGEIFTSHYWKATSSPAKHLYRPVTLLSFAMERKLTGGRPDPRLSHVVNILLHDLTAILLFLYVRRLGGGVFAGGAGALVFVAHPLLSQAVVNVVGRADLLAALFSLAALLWMTGTDDRAGTQTRTAARQRVAAWGSAAALFLALGSKEIAVATPFLLVWQQVVILGSSGRRTRAWWLQRAIAFSPVVLTALAYVALRTNAIEDFPGPQQVLPLNNILVGMHGMPRVATTLAMAATYGRLFVLPNGLSADYSGVAVERFSSMIAAAPAFGFLILALFAILMLAPPILARRRGGRALTRVEARLSMGAALTLLPYLVIGNVLVLNGAGFAERMIYFSATGVCLLIGTILGAVRDRLPRTGRRAMAVALGVVIVAGVWQARSVSRMWAGAEALFETSLRATPGSLRSHYALAQIRERQGRLDEALALHEGAVRVWPDHGPSWLYMGVVLARQGRLEEAEAAIRRSVEIRPDVGEGWMYLGLVLSRRGDLETAERAMRKALACRPRLVKAEAELGHLLFRQGRYAEAAAAYRRCIRSGREDLRPNLERALAAARTGGGTAEQR